MATTKKTKEVGPRPEPTERDKAVIAQGRVRTQARLKRVQLASGEKDGQVQSPHDDPAGFEAALLDAFGTTSKAFVERAVSQISTAMQRGGSDTINSLNAGMAAVAGIRPENEAEAMLAIQMAATHEAALSMLALARANGTVPGIQAAGGLAVRLLRTYTAQIEALHKIRRGGEQTVRVEHVNVYPGGQAIVGNVSQGGGGGAGEKRDQPHAPGEPRALGATSVTPLRSEDQERQLVPVAGDA